MRALLLTAVAWALLAPRAAHADPNLWQRARDPVSAAQQVVLNRVERTLGAIGLSEIDPELSAAAVALSMLSRTMPQCRGPADVAQPRTPAQARFDYLIGGALLDSHSNREADARCFLERALRVAPYSPLAARGWFRLGIAGAVLGDRRAERASYVQALAVTWAPDVRAILRSNLAESEMGSGDLKAALRDYRLALGDARQPEALASAYFGLAVALDRSGDLPSALDAAERANAVQLPTTLFSVSSVLDLPGTFFTPNYEIHYYKALAAMAEARQAKDEAALRAALVDAEEQWSRYLSSAEAEHAVWAPRARLHQARIARELAAMTAKPVKPHATPRAPRPTLL